MKKILFAAYVLALCANAEASLIFGNSVTGPYQAGTNFGTKSVGFLTGSSALLLDDIQVALGAPNGGGGTLTFTLNSDASGLPGGVLATIGSQTVATFSATSAFTLTPATPLALAANTAYWIQVAIDGGEWGRTDPQIAPSSGLATFLGYVFNGANSTTFNAIIVDGRSIAAAIPEPETYAMLVAGLAMLGFVSRRRKQSSA